MVCEMRNAQQGCGFGFGSGFGIFSESSLRSFLAMDYSRGNGLFSSDDDSREEQQRCASSWGWPEECRFRDPVQPAR